MRVLLRFPVLAVTLFVVGCMSGPNNGDVWCGTDFVGQYSGELIEYGTYQQPERYLRVRVEAGPTANGPWSVVSSQDTSGNSRSNWHDSDANDPFDPEYYTKWDAPNAVVPDWAWSGGDPRVTYVRTIGTRNNGTEMTFYAFDNDSLHPNQETWGQCLNRQVGATHSLGSATSRCSSGFVAKVSAPARSACKCPNKKYEDYTTGDLTISTPDDVTKYACIEHITKGSLTISGAPGTSMLLPALLGVSGNVTIKDGMTGDVNLPLLNTVGGDVTIDYSPYNAGYQRYVSMPNLTTIKGSLELGARTITQAGVTVYTGLDALTSLGKNLQVTFNMGMGGRFTLTGLPRLLSIPGDVNMSLGANLTGDDFLRNLSFVGGSFTTTSYSELHGILRSLDTVTKDFKLFYKSQPNAPLVADIGFQELRSVGGDFVLQNTPWGSFPVSTSQVNFAEFRPASQSSTAFGGDAARAVDGVTTGVWGNGSVTHTNSDANAWWQVDLGQVRSISSIQIYGRTDPCCTDRLSNFYVFVSPVPFTSTDLNTTLQQPNVWNSFVKDQALTPMQELPVNQTGRYVRIQLKGTNYLSLAEVRVLGQPKSALSSLADVVGKVQLLATLLSSVTFGTDTLKMGSLEVTYNPNLTAIPPRSVFVRADGPVSITDNPQLLDCAVDAFLNGLKQRGWAGTATTENNGGSCE